MGKITKKEVEHIAMLSRLALTDSEKEKYGKQLSGILDWVEQLNKVNTTSIEPIANITGLENVMEDDEVKPCGISREELLKNAPKEQDGYIRVKAVFE